MAAKSIWPSGPRIELGDWAKELYDQKFKLVMETDVTPEQVLADAEEGLQSVRAEMLELALPMHKQMYPDHGDHSDLGVHERQNLIITEVLHKISDEHPRPEDLQKAIEADLESIKQFIREKKIVSLGTRDNLKVIPTPHVRARHLFRGGISQRATARTSGRSGILGDSYRPQNAGRQSGIQAARVQQLHAGVAEHSRSASRALRSIRALE